MVLKDVCVKPGELLGLLGQSNMEEKGAGECRSRFSGRTLYGGKPL